MGNPFAPGIALCSKFLVTSLTFCKVIIAAGPTFAGAAQHCLNVHMSTEASNFGFKQLYFHLVLLALHPKNPLKNQERVAQCPLKKLRGKEAADVRGQ